MSFMSLTEKTKHTELYGNNAYKDNGRILMT